MKWKRSIKEDHSEQTCTSGRDCTSSLNKEVSYLDENPCLITKKHPSRKMNRDPPLIMVKDSSRKQIVVPSYDVAMEDSFIDYEGRKNLSDDQEKAKIPIVHGKCDGDGQVIANPTTHMEGGEVFCGYQATEHEHMEHIVNATTLLFFSLPKVLTS